MTGDEATAIIAENEKARIRALRVALAVVAIVAALALFFAGGIPTRQPGSEPAADGRGQPDLARAEA